MSTPLLTKSHPHCTQHNPPTSPKHTHTIALKFMFKIMCKSYSHQSKITRFICVARRIDVSDAIMRWGNPHTHTHTQTQSPFIVSAYHFIYTHTYKHLVVYGTVNWMCQLARYTVNLYRKRLETTTTPAAALPHNNRAYIYIRTVAVAAASSIQIFIAQIDFSFTTHPALPHQPPSRNTHSHHTYVAISQILTIVAVV